jgi:hypothetical protein
MAQDFSADPQKSSILPEIAAQALLAYLFESCDIFEDDPAKVAS